MIIQRGRPPTPSYTFQRRYISLLQIFSSFSIFVFSLLRKIYFYLQILSFSPPFFFTSTKIYFPSPNIFLLFFLRLIFPLHKNIFFPSPNIIFCYLLLLKKDPSFSFSFPEISIQFVERNEVNTDHCPPLGEVWKHPFRLCRQQVKKSTTRIKPGKWYWTRF